MDNYNIFDVLKPALILSIIAFFVCYLQIGFTKTLPLILIKFSIPTIYFGFFFEPSMTFFDDVHYYYKALMLGTDNLGLFSLLTSTETYKKAIELSEGIHVLYAFYNLLALHFFGPWYFSPIFLNTFLSLVGGIFLVKTFLMMGFEKRYCFYLFYFYSLHWDVLTWTSFYNLKDPLVLNLAIICFYFLIATEKQFSIFNLLAAGVTISLLFFLRSYTPVLILMSFSIYILKFYLYKIPVRHIASTIIGFTLIAFFLPENFISYYLDRIQLNQFFLGILRASLTPMPWNIDSQYSPITLAAVAHWIFFFPSLIGGYYMLKQKNFSQVYIIYFILGCTLMALYPQLQGPRQRVQISIFFILAQFQIFWMIFMDPKTLVKSLVAGKAR